MNKKGLNMIAAKRMLLLVAVVMTACIANAQSCRYCGGTGTVVKNLGTAQYGLSGDYKVRCSTCGAVTLKSTGHAHIHCTHCGGSGKSSSNKRETGISSSDELAYSNPKLYNDIQLYVQTSKYGLVMTDAEQAEVEKLDSYNAKKYMKWRSLLNAYTIDMNKSIVMGWDAVGLNFADRMIAGNNDNLNRLVSTFTITPELKRIADNLLQQYNQATQRYRSMVAAKQSVNDLNDQLLNYYLTQPW